jgi:hypothetical protein
MGETRREELLRELAAVLGIPLQLLDPAEVEI